MRKLYKNLLETEEDRSGSGIPKESLVIKRKLTEALKKAPFKIMGAAMFLFSIIGVLVVQKHQKN